MQNTFVRIITQRPTVPENITAHIVHLQLRGHIHGLGCPAKGAIVHAAVVQIRTLAKNIFKSLSFDVRAVGQLHTAKQSGVLVRRTFGANVAEPISVGQIERPLSHHVPVLKTTVRKKE